MLYRAQISGRQTPGLTRGSLPLLYNKCGGFDVLRCGPRYETAHFMNAQYALYTG
jgi:hypothetical protein